MPKLQVSYRWLASHRFRSSMRGGRDRLLGLLFPPACLACRVSLESETPCDSKHRFCNDCLEEFAFFGDPCCQGCGRSVPTVLSPDQRCKHCIDRKPRYQQAVALGPYGCLLRDLLLQAKRPQGEIAVRGLAHLLADRLLEERLPAEGENESLAPRGFDVVCPVPMHWTRRVGRLASSANSLADVVARRLEVPVAMRLLVRRRRTQPQSNLPPTGRLENVRQAFSIGRGHRLTGAHVLLIDDILTTGATCNEAARILLRNGASEVTVAVVARSFTS